MNASRVDLAMPVCPSVCPDRLSVRTLKSQFTKADTDLIKTRKNAIVEYPDYQIPVNGTKGYANSKGSLKSATYQ